MSLQILDAIDDEEVQALDAEAPEEVVEKEEKKEQPRDTAADTRQIVAEVLRSMQPGQPQNVRPSRLEMEVQNLLKEGVNPDAIAKILRIREADRADEAERAAHQAARQNDAAFDQACWGIAEAKLAEYSKNIPFLKNAKDGLKKDLLTEVNEVITNHSDYASVRAQVQSRRLPDGEKVGTAVAKVVDKFCKENGIVKKAAPLELKSSKAETTEKAFSEADVDKLSKGAKQIFSSSLKYTGDPKKALKRAQQYAAETGA